MADYPFDWVDAFTEDRFGGNACAVVYNADPISIDLRTALVRETSLSECAYIVASEKADFGARYYLAEREIPMAGHPTIATVASLIDRGFVEPTPEGTDFTIEVGAGVLPITVTARSGKPPLISMIQKAPEFGRKYTPGEIAALYGLQPEDILFEPQIVSTGTPFCIAVVRDHQALRRARLDVDALKSWQSESQMPGAGLMEPFLVSLEGATDQGDTFSRLLLAPPMPAEDPFTGSATGCMGAYLWHHQVIPSADFIAEQGHWLGRPGRADVSVMGEPDAISGVRVSGTGIVLMRGHLDLS